MERQAIALFTTLEQEIFVTGSIMNHKRVHRELQKVAAKEGRGQASLPVRSLGSD